MSSEFLLKLGNQKYKAVPDVYQDHIGVYAVKDYFSDQFLAVAASLGYTPALVGRVKNSR